MTHARAEPLPLHPFFLVTKDVQAWSGMWLLSVPWTNQPAYDAHGLALGLRWCLLWGATVVGLTPVYTDPQDVGLFGAQHSEGFPRRNIRRRHRAPGPAIPAFQEQPPENLR